MLRIASVCSGIGGAELAFAGIAEYVFMSEIDPFACAILKHHFPEVPLHGDFTTIEAETYGRIDVLVGGTPCQAFSVAGLRGGLADARGNLALEFLRLAERLRPRWILWENVPGVLSSTSHDASGPRQPPDDMAEGSEWVDNDEYDAGENHAFACFLAGFSELGYGWAYRSLDAQYFDLAQRRERVFFVGYLGDWRRAAAVLFEPASLRGDSAPSREARESVASPLAGCAEGGSGYRNDTDTADNLIAPPITSNPYGDHESQEGLLHAVARSLDAHPGRGDGESETFIVAATLTRGADSVGKGGYAGRHREDDINPTTHALRADGFDASEDGTGRGTPLSPIAFDTTQITSPVYRSQNVPDGPCHTLAEGAHPPTIAFGWQNSHHQGDSVDEHTTPTLDKSKTPAVAFQTSQSGIREADAHATLDANNGSRRHNGVVSSGVRRLTPRECERLQGVPDGFTAISYRGKPAADGPRYRALGNGFAVPVVRWIAKRLAREYQKDAGQ